MKDYYQILGLKSSASTEEIKRSYRILARRYHPDINHSPTSADRFKEIQEAYNTLRDVEKKKLYDATAESFLRAKFNQKLKSYAHQKGNDGTEKTPRSKTEFKGECERTHVEEKFQEPIDPFGEISGAINSSKSFISKRWSKLKNKLSTGAKKLKSKPIKVSIVEVSVSIEDSIRGIKKKIEIVEPGEIRKVSVYIPSGVRDGSVIRLRNQAEQNEDLVLIVRLSAHPFLSIKQKGLIVEVPITIHEAMYGTQIKVPAIEDSVLIKVAAGTQSGTEVRLPGHGIRSRDGKRGDLFVKFLIVAPFEPNAPGLKEKVEELQGYYDRNVRERLPNSIIS